MTAREFQRPADELAQRLLGARLIHTLPDGSGPRSGRIVETEAYLATDDPGSHSAVGRTDRNGSMFERGGVAYVYRIYGLHHCFNVVSGPAGSGEAVLIRALEPEEGVEAMVAARGVTAAELLCSGPGRLVEALGIGAEHDGTPLVERRRSDAAVGPLRIELDEPVGSHQIAVGRRIGLGQGQDLALRFGLRGSPWLSRSFA